MDGGVGWFDKRLNGLAEDIMRSYGCIILLIYQSVCEYEDY